MKENVKLKLIDNEQGYLGLMLRKANNAYRNKVEKTLKKKGVTGSQFSILSAISSFPMSSNAEIARIAHLTPQTVNLMVNKLHKENALKKSKHSQNKLVQLLEITDHGERLLQESNELILNSLDKKLDFEFTKEELAIVRKWLCKVIEDDE
ncbi:MarR family transcriptional regulator [Acinetobacter lactucae]|uniref:MarR family winged helix-turn-helix transcriptional regulator n=1 Tax=Acinetobacter lactucae TaxID=1785128 RepID=UPI0021CDA794|nr:MarR family transcriptional regulator [Acinetobacter lactucae]MCU4347726.1 MarR family transcriptional regulator [Acinetobacter lactucae]